MRNETGIKTISFKCILPKSPDVLSMDYNAFGLLKQALYKQNPETLDGLCKIAQEKWKIQLLQLF